MENMKKISLSIEEIKNKRQFYERKIENILTDFEKEGRPRLP